MILDVLSAFCFNDTFLTTGYSTSKTTAGTTGGGYIDLGASDAFALSSNEGTEYYGVGEPINVCALVTEKMDDAGTPRTVTVTVTLETADDAAFTSNLTTLMTLGVFAAGSAAGTKLITPLPIGSLYRRYLRAKFTVSSTLTGGKFSCFLCKDVDIAPAYPSRVNVS